MMHNEPYGELFSYSTIFQRLEPVAQAIERGESFWDHITNFSSSNEFVRASLTIDPNSMQITAFYTLYYEGRDISPANFTENHGWKFHISLNDVIPDNVARGWDIVKDILIQHKVRTAKVVRPGFQLRREQSGKQITIYAWHNTEKEPQHWLQIIDQITRNLVVANPPIQPGFRCIGSIRVPERNWVTNNYVTYRYELPDERRKRAITSINVIQVPPDPYKSHVFDIPNQPPHQQE